MGMNIKDAFLHVKKVQSTTILQEGSEGGLSRFKESPPSSCLMLTNLIIPEQVSDPNEYRDVEDETFDEMEQYGRVEQVIAPRPSRNYVPGKPLEPGVGKVFVKFGSIRDAEIGKKAMTGRRFEGRIVDASFYPDESFMKGIFE